MQSRKSMTLPIIITLILLLIIIYLFTNIQQEKVVCEKVTTFDNDIVLDEVVTATIDSDKISNIHLVKKITLPDKFLNDETYNNSIKYSLENTLEYLKDNVKYNTSSNSISVVIDVSDDELVLLDNISFDSSDDLGMKINTNTVSGDVITLGVGDEYTAGKLMKKLKNNSYSCS